MLQKKIITSSWGIGLSQAQIALLRETLGDDHELLLHPDFPQGGEKALTNSKEPSPHVIWISSRSGSDLRALPEALAHYQDPAHIVLLLDEGYDINDIEHAFDNGISEIIRPPLTRERIIEIMRRALEMRALHADMDAMTREIVLERELLERKNNILSFLVNFLALTSENTELDTLLCTAFAGFSRLLPLRAMNAVLWDNTEQTPSATLYISANQNSAAYGNWRSALLHHTSLNLGGQFSIQGITALNLEGKTGFAAQAQPGDGALLSLPLVCGQEQFGLLLLLIDSNHRLGRDQATALDSAVHHFSLTVKNAKRFIQMQEYANYDALTRVHSRRHFECRLKEEMQRFTRYEQPFSLLLLDVDYFKRVNDAYGHHVGDLVLREMGNILKTCVRNTDYCARYGGEEFVVILPYTGYKRAMTLADRIREAIAGHVFFADGVRPFRVTASIGVANIDQNTPKSMQNLLQEADKALYTAKEEGRNRICFAPASLMNNMARSTAG